jgi:hypothetical protein
MSREHSDPRYVIGETEMAKALITYAEAVAAKERMIEIQEMEDRKGLSVAQKACADLIRFFQTQERYALEARTPADYERALQNRSKSEAKELDKLTPEQVREMQRLAIGDDYPGKPKGRPS